MGPAVIRGRLKLVSPFVCASASCSSAPVVLWMFCRLFFVIYVLSLSGLRFVVSLSVFVLALSLSLSLSLSSLRLSCLVLPCLVLSCRVFVCFCFGFVVVLVFVLSSLLFFCLVLILSCLVCSLCRLGGRVGSFLVVLGVFLGRFWSS